MTHQHDQLQPETAEPSAAPVSEASPQPAPQPAAVDAHTGPIPAETPDRTDVTQAIAPDRALLDLASRPDSDSDEGSNGRLSWGSRSDVGLIRGHNEDSYLIRPPLFAVSDGMGGHAAGEVASSIAIHTLAQQAPATADSAALGAAIEAANTDIIVAPETGRGREGMGCTLTACLIENDKMAVAHVGDSRLYLLHKGTLVRVTHDHSFVEELVDAGEITPDEARVHPSRSVITRALGSDPDMYADHFTLDVEAGERVILCSDGISSMIPDAELEDICVTSASPQVCADALVSAALVAGGHDNATVIVVDILDDGKEVVRRRTLRRNVTAWALALVAVVALVAGIVALIVNTSCYLSVSDGKVALYSGIPDVGLGHLEQTTDVDVSLLPETIQNQLRDGIQMPSQRDAESTIQSYRTQIADAQAKAAETAESVKDAAESAADQPAGAPSDTETGGDAA